MPGKVAIVHQLVDKEQIAVAAIMAPAHELQEFLVMKPAYDHHVRGMLLSPMLGALGNSLDGHAKV